MPASARPRWAISWRATSSKAAPYRWRRPRAVVRCRAGDARVAGPDPVDRLTMGDVATAIEQQNLEISPGRIGDSPGVPGQRITVPLSADGQLSTPEQFVAIVLRAGADGSRVVLGDVARVELGAQSYAWGTREDGHPATAAGVQLRPAANAVRTAAAVRERMAGLAPLPRGWKRASRSTPRRSWRYRSRRWCRPCWRRCWCSR